jgi:hypothetical protein
MFDESINGKVLGFWVTSGCRVKMMWLCHVSDWRPDQTASSIYLRHLKNVWAHWYAVHRHMVGALNCYPPYTWLIYWGSGSLVESKWCHYVIVDADSHLKLIPASILDIYKVFEYIDMLSMAYGSSLTQLYPPYLAQILVFWNTCGVKMMWLYHGWCW